VPLLGERCVVSGWHRLLVVLVVVAVAHPAEVARLADVIDARYRALALVGAYGGLHSGELAGQRRRRVDLLRGTVDVAEIVVKVRGGLRGGLLAALIEGAAAPCRLAVVECEGPVRLQRTPDTPGSQYTPVSVRTAPNDNQSPSWRSRNSTTQPGCPALLGSMPRTVASGKLWPRTNDRLVWLAGPSHSSAQRRSEGRLEWVRSHSKSTAATTRRAVTAVATSR
jgi:hypothetical protein